MLGEEASATVGQREPKPKHDTTEWHLPGRMGLRQHAVMQAETALAAFATGWAIDQGLRVFDWRSMVADRQQWE